MVYVLLPEEEEDGLFYIGMQVKSLYSLGYVDFFGSVCPGRDRSDTIRYIVHDDRYEGPDDYSSQKKYDDKNTDTRHPRRDPILFSLIDEGIDDDGEKSRDHDDKKNISCGIQDITKDPYSYKSSDLFDPESEFSWHKQSIRRYTLL